MKTKFRPLFLALIDLSIVCVALVAFALFHHVLPGSVSEGLGVTPGVNAVFDFPGRFTDGAVEEEREGNAYHYRDGSLDLMVTKREEDGITYTLAEFYLKDLSRFRTAFAGGEYVTGVADSVLNMAAENDALLTELSEVLQ